MTMKRSRRTVSAADFKARCLKLLDQVAANKDVLVVTKRGKAVAKVIPVDDAEPRNLRGSVRYHGDIVAPIEDAWDVAR
jgi:prevent-host-death family protein